MKHRMNLLVLVAMMVAVMCVGWVDGRTCKVGKSHSAWKHGGGTFRKTAPGSLEWIEYDGNGVAGSSFMEELKEGDQIVITNAERGISILLRNDLAGIRNKGEHNFQQLYQGGWMRVADCTKD
mmetsp:Transcript_80259/g.93722  ORF Transcript_80259/g.93722 Transcript_80259/m.93722 type:complete len:123 (+) Transcript_80259:73-441(+)